jgi:transcriptional regulator with XRE-family HTH domain
MGVDVEGVTVEENPDGVVVRQVGRLLQAARARSGLSQRQVAERAGTSQQWVSRVERGAGDVRVGALGRLFVVVGTRLVVQAVAVGDDDPADPDLVPAEGLAAAQDAAAAEFRYLLRRFAAVPVVVGGRLAALAQALPVVPSALDLVVARADVEPLRDAMALLSLQKWDERLQDHVGFDPDPAGPPPRRWSVAGMFELRIELVDELPGALAVELGGLPMRVLPLAHLLRDDIDVAILAERLRQQRGRVPGRGDCRRG